MYSYFISYVGFCSTEDQISNGATPHVAYPIQSIRCLRMSWLLNEPGHQHAWYWSPKPKYSVSSIWRVKTNDPQIIADNIKAHGTHQQKSYHQLLNYTIITSFNFSFTSESEVKKDCKCAQNQNMIRSRWNINKALEILSPGQIKPLTSIYSREFSGIC